jgi:long-chain acyl-CoA synthetase
MLLDRGIAPGTRIAIRATSTITEATLFFAVQFAGGVVVPLSARTADRQLELVDRMDPAYLLAVDPDESSAPVEQTITVTCAESGRVVCPASELDYSAPGFDRGSEDLAAIVPTAGTTGEPTTPALTNRNLLAGATMLDQRLSVTSDDVVATVAPPTHVLSLVAPLAAWSAGGTTADVTIADLLADLRQTSPTRLLTVPRLCRRLYGTIERLREGGGRLLSRVLHWADDVAREYGAAVATDEEIGYRLRARHALANRLVFAALRRRLGLDRVSEIVAAGGPVDPELQTVFRGMGLPLLSGYGTTETSGFATMPDPGDVADGTVGAPLPDCTVRLADDGEVLVAGPQVIDRYWRDEPTTRGAIIDDWFHTGDLGHWHDDEALGLLDRKPHMQTLQDGTPVSPVRVERALRRSPVIADALAIAEDRPHVTALLQPAFETLIAWAERDGVSIDGVERDEPGTVIAVDADALDRPPVRNRFDDAVSDANERLDDHETVEGFQVLDRSFRLDEGELSPLLEKRRDRIRARFDETIDGLYE